MPELIAVLVNPTSVDQVAIQNDDGSFGSLTPLDGLASHDFSRDAALGDLNGDGHVDAYVSYGFTGPSTVWLNDGTGAFASTGQTLGGPDALAVALGDVNGDGHLDAVVARTGASGTGPGRSNLVYLNDGTGTFTEAQALGANHSLDVVLVDVDNDDDLDAIFANTTPQDEDSVLWLNDGTGQFAFGQRIVGTQQAVRVASGHIDDDAFVDLVYYDFTTAGSLIAYGSANGFLEAVAFLDDFGTPPDQPEVSGEVVVDDFDGDGFLDIARTANGVGTDVWFGDAVGGYSRSIALAATGATAITAVDLNGDERLDIVTSGDNAAVAAFLQNETGGFDAQADLFPGATPARVAFAESPQSVEDPGPVAADDAGAGFVTDEDTAVTIAPLANDSGAETEPLLIGEINGRPVASGDQVALPSGAQLTVNPDGTLGYDPNGAFDALVDGQSETDSFAYRALQEAQDAVGAGGARFSNEATVTMTIEGVGPASATYFADAFSIVEAAGGAEDTKLASNHAGALSPNGEFLDLGRDPGDGFEILYQAAGAGQATLSFRYAVNGAGQRPAEVFVDGVSQGVVAFPGTGSWSNWGEISIPITLSAGANTISVRQLTDLGPNIDTATVTPEPGVAEGRPSAAITITPPADAEDDIVATIALSDVSAIDDGSVEAGDFVLSGPSAPGVVLFDYDADADIATIAYSAPAGGWAEGAYEVSAAENAIRDDDGNGNLAATAALSLDFTPATAMIYTSDAFVIVEGTGGADDTKLASNHAGADSPNGAFLDFGNDAGDGFEIAYLAEAPTEATLSLRYAVAGAPRPAEVLVDGVSQGVIAFQSTGGWSAWSDASITITLAAGLNTIRVAQTTGAGPNVDTATVAPFSATPPAQSNFATAIVFEPEDAAAVEIDFEAPADLLM